MSTTHNSGPVRRMEVWTKRPRFAPDPTSGISFSRRYPHILGTCAMASGKTLNAKNLEALGAQRLAALLIEISKGDAAAKRRLRLELAGTQGPTEVAREVRKRLGTLARSRSFIDWQKRTVVANDLQTQRKAIMEKVAKSDPAAAMDLMWSFMEVADSIFDRTDDSSGTLLSVFEEALEDLAELAKAAKPDPIALADKVFLVTEADSYNQYDGVISLLAPALGAKGLAHLKKRIEALAAKPPPKSKDDRVVIGWSSNGPIYEDETRERMQRIVVRMALQEIADAQGDVDAFIAQYDPETRRVPSIAAKIADRLLQAGRAEEALAAVDAIDQDRPAFIPPEWEDARIGALEALGRMEEAQDFRWACFQRSLSQDHLKAYLKHLPDFDDMEAEEKALDFVQSHPSFHHALHFLIEWPSLDRAASLILDRVRELDGDHYYVLTPAADALAEKHPLAATLALRAMIEFALDRARGKRYRHAARHLMDCQGLAARIDQFGDHESHEAFEARLQGRHGRKSLFWSLAHD